MRFVISTAGLALLLLQTGCISARHTPDQASVHFADLREFWVFVGSEHPIYAGSAMNEAAWHFPTNSESLNIWAKNSQWTSEKLVERSGRLWPEDRVWICKPDFYDKDSPSGVRGAHGNGEFYILRKTRLGFDLVGQMDGCDYEARYERGWLKLSTFWHESMNPTENGGFAYEWTGRGFVQTRACRYEYDQRKDEYIYSETPL